MTSPPRAPIWETLATHIGLLMSGAAKGRSGSFDRMCFACSGETVADINLAALWGTATHEDVERLLGHLDDLDAMVVVSERGKDRLGPDLREAGLMLGGPCPLMTAGLTGSAADRGPYRVEAVQSLRGLATMVDVLAEAYSIAHEHMSAAFGSGLLTEPNATPFIASLNGEARSALISTRVGADVGIWEVGTPKRFQRQGAGRALLTDVMARAAADGAERCFLFPSPAGRRLYDSLGFVDTDRSEIWLKGSSTEFPKPTT